MRGTPVPLLQDVAGNAISAGGQFDFSRNGTFVYLSGTGVTQNLAWLDSAGGLESLHTPPGAYFDLRLSPDGKRLALSEAATNIVVWDWQREQMQRLTFTQGSRFPVWAPDGRHLVYSSQATSLQWIRADGGADVQALLTSKSQLAPYSFSPDGKRLAYTETTPDTGYDVWTLPLDIADPEHPKPGQPELFLRTPFSESEPAFSPDGHWLAYTSNESGEYRVYVRPFLTRNGDASGKW